MRRDIQVGLRSLAASPAFALVSILSLALGIMATTAIYSVLHAVVIDPFPYKDVDRLMSVRVSSTRPGGGRLGYSVDQFLEIAERNTIFEGVVASTISDVVWTGEGDPQRLRGNHGTFNTFAVMGVRPLIGRTPAAEDARPGAPPVVVLGYRFWQRQFGGDPTVLGRQLRLNDTSRTVIGVMPKRFMWRGADVYLPLAFQRGQTLEGVRNVHLLGRLKPGVTEAQAAADLTPIVKDLKAREPDQFPDEWRVGLLSFKETFRSGIRGDLWVLFGAVALLLFIACANVSNLLLSRASARQREMTVRAALGASRWRLVRQLLTESLMLALAGGLVGTALAHAGLPAILSIVPPGTIPDESEISLNRSVLIFTLMVSALTSILCGLAPALHSSGRDLAGAMREASRGLAGSTKQAWLRKILVVGEVALSLMLLAGSSLLVRTYMAIQDADLGFRADRVLTLRVPLAARNYPDAARRVAFFQDVLGRVSRLPGVTAVGLNSGLHPFGNMRTRADVTGAPPSDEPVEVHHVNAGYTAALGIRLASGRTFTDADVNAAAPVALVNDRFVRTRLEGRQPLGQFVRLPRLKQPPFGMKEDAFQIVGVVHDVLNRGVADPAMPEIYVPFTAVGIANLLVVRTENDPSTVTRAVISQIYGVDPGQPVTEVKPLDVILREEEFATPRFNLVAQQRHEIGVRMALGASAGTIARMIIGRGSRLLVVGIVLGLAGSILAARSLAQQVWKVSPFDPVAFGLVSLILLAAGLQACVWPARRAARIDPLVALRQD